MYRHNDCTCGLVEPKAVEGIIQDHRGGRGVNVVNVDDLRPPSMLVVVWSEPNSVCYRESLHS